MIAKLSLNPEFSIGGLCLPIYVMAVGSANSFFFLINIGSANSDSKEGQLLYIIF